MKKANTFFDKHYHLLIFWLISVGVFAVIGSLLVFIDKQPGTPVFTFGLLLLIIAAIALLLELAVVIIMALVTLTVALVKLTHERGNC